MLKKSVMLSQNTPSHYFRISWNIFSGNLENKYQKILLQLSMLFGPFPGCRI